MGIARPAVFNLGHSAMRFVSSSEIRDSLSFPRLIEALEIGHRRPRTKIQDTMLGSENGHYFVRHAVEDGRLIGSKLITSFPENLHRGDLPAVQAVMVVFDGTNGKPIAVMDGTEITYWRTAADSALGSKFLAPTKPEILLVVGAGSMAPCLIEAHCMVRPSIRRIIVWNRTIERAAQIAARVNIGKVEVEVGCDLDQATRIADIITTCTRSNTPLIRGDNLKSGTHLDLVGGYSERTREADDEAMRRASIFVDRRESALDGVGDILQPIASGAIRVDDIRGDLYDLASGLVSGRQCEREITVFKNAGGGHLDLITAEVVLQQLELLA